MEYSSKEGSNPPQLVITNQNPFVKSRNRPATRTRRCRRPKSVASLLFSPVDNAIIKESLSDMNFAHVTDLSARYGRGSRVDSLLKFRFDNCRYTENVVSKAVLKMYCKNGTPRGGKLISVIGAWEQDSVTWNNSPSYPLQFYEVIGRVRKEDWVEIDVTSAIISADGDEVTFRMEGMHPNAAVYASTKDAKYKPVLEIIF